MGYEISTVQGFPSLKFIVKRIWEKLKGKPRIKKRMIMDGDAQMHPH